ncbi:MAG TPA: penicillin-binding transpeptidase domain-containing protein [Solirubrobacteraceae bacterium]|jgi:cell division protein FtsI/penicillin-binding protein 2|nr:penicillin-binding transpeptidase domain-containing protein [Solirubrobacteraceae bacterium]
MPTPARRRGGLRRFWAVGALAAVALAIGLLVGALHTSGTEHVARAWAADWERGDYSAMYAMLTDEAARRTSASAFAAAYRRAADTATTTGVRVAEPVADGKDYDLPVVMRTRVFGAVRGTVVLPIVGKGDGARVAWNATLVFPGLRAGEQLHRTVEMPPRASLLARDGQPLAAGPSRSSTLGAVAANVVGSLGPAPADERGRLEREGIPAATRVGVTGLERIFDARLLGRPGGRLTAGLRTLAYVAPKRGRDVRTTISVGVETAAIAALGDRVGGIVALRPGTGEILAYAGIPFSGLQPPGSTFKMVTLAAALESGIATAHTVYPYATYATVEGVNVSNANGESCGGTLSLAFAVSCNSVFVPLGVRVGADRLVKTAEALGFNRPVGIAGAATSTIPQPGEIGDDLAVGSSAIGQGRVQATALQMTTIAATIANGGRRPRLTLDADDRRSPGARAISARTAATVGRLMVGVVRRGTGVNAAIPGVAVAGKTGTAELRTTVPCTSPPPQAGTDTTSTATTGAEACSSDSQADDPTDTDAWFASYAPAEDPRVAVGVMLVQSGAGADTAAPAAKTVLEAALSATAP